MYGENRIPPLHLESVPTTAKSLALIVDDPDAPGGTFTHWLLFNVNPQSKEFAQVPAGAKQGVNNYGKTEYGGPKPPSGEHRYFFKAFALDETLPLANGAKRDELEAAMKYHIVDEAVLMGTYAHSN